MQYDYSTGSRLGIDNLESGLQSPPTAMCRKVHTPDLGLLTNHDAERVSCRRFRPGTNSHTVTSLREAASRLKVWRTLVRAPQILRTTSASSPIPRHVQAFGRALTRGSTQNFHPLHTPSPYYGGRAYSGCIARIRTIKIQIGAPAKLPSA